MKDVQVKFGKMTEEEKLNLVRQFLDRALDERIGSDAESRLEFLDYVAIQVDVIMDEIEEDAGVMLSA